MSEVTIESVKLYATEAMEHGQRYCYLLDVLAHLVLWRGKLPIHSFVFFVGLYAAIDFPRFIPSILVLLVAFTLLSNNYYISSHPSRWSRVRSFVRVAVNHYLPSKNPNIVIEPEICEDDHEGKLRDRVDEYRGLRVIAFLYKAMKTALGVYRVYSKNTPLDISTASNSANLFSKLYADYLCYLHVFLRCKFGLACAPRHVSISPGILNISSFSYHTSIMRVYSIATELCQLEDRKCIQVRNRLFNFRSCMGSLPL